MARTFDRDKLSADDMMRLWIELKHLTRDQAEEIVGDRRPGFTKIPPLIGCYFCNLAVVLQCAARGQDKSAGIYAQHTRLTLERIPVDVRARCGLPEPFEEERR